MSENSSQFIIQSKIDNQQFTVNKKIIDSSVLLKNICDITRITEPILLDCPGNSLEAFITLLNHYETCEDKHDTEFEKNLFDSVTSNNKQNLIKIIQDLCILDSDFFLDSVADYILGIIGFKELMDWTHIQTYLGLENDFTEDERKFIDGNKQFEYFLSLESEAFKFPFPNKSLYSLKTDFSTPMNCLISRIIQRSNEKISYLLSLINKTIKNEVDRHPLKLTKFSCAQHWYLILHFERLKRSFHFTLDPKHEKYFNILKTRMVFGTYICARYGKHGAAKPFVENNSLNFVISQWHASITFDDNYDSIYQFDLTKCSISEFYYNFRFVKNSGMTFEEFYNHLIAKDLSKKIMILMASSDIFDFFSAKPTVRFYKNQNSSKFESLEIYGQVKMLSGFKNFIMNYMEDDGIIKSTVMIPGIPLEEIGVIKIGRYYNYSVSNVNKYWDYIVAK